MITLRCFQALLREAEGDSCARDNSRYTDGLGTEEPRSRRTISSGPSTSSASADGNLRFIREEINKKCRRVYQAFITCYQKLP